MATEDRKRAVAVAAVDAYVRDGMCVGLGTGTTAFWAIERVGERIAEGWIVRAVPTSEETARHCRERGIPLVELPAEDDMHVAIDGADEVAPDFALIKGGGGALFREKTVALAARTFVVVVTEEKLVAELGRFPLPVEVVPFARLYAERAIRAFCPTVALRAAPGGTTFITDNGNVILDCSFGSIDAPRELDERLREIHGVVTTGLFVNIAANVFVGANDGVRELARRQ